VPVNFANTFHSNKQIKDFHRYEYLVTTTVVVPLGQLCITLGTNNKRQKQDHVIIHCAGNIGIGEDKRQGLVKSSGQSVFVSKTCNRRVL